MGTKQQRIDHNIFRLHPLTFSLMLCLMGMALPSTAYSTETESTHNDNENAADHENGVVQLSTITLYATADDAHQKAKNEMYSKDISNVYADREEVERYQVSSAGDLFKGLNGVYTGDSRNSGAIDPNIRGIQGEGRVPLTIDGTEQSTSVWMGPSGVANRNYIDPNMVSSILVEKGSSMSSPISGIGGSVQVKTLQVDDIVQAGERFGIELKTDTSTNSIAPNQEGMNYFGQDYRDIPGAYANKFSRGALMAPSLTKTPRIGDGGKDFNFDAAAYRIAIATKQDQFDLLGAYSYRKRGNYYSGKNNSSKYQTDTWQEDARKQTEIEAMSGQPSISYLAKYFLPGDEVSNTSSEQESTLLKGTWRISDAQTLNASFMRNELSFGEQVPWMISEAVRGSDGSRLNQYQFPYSQVKQDTWTLNYTLNPDNRWLDLKAGAWLTQNNTSRHQNGDAVYGIGVSWDSVQSDQAWENYTRCHVLHEATNDCSLIPSTPPEKLANDDGRFNVLARALQLTDHKRVGFNLSNTFKLKPNLDFTLSGDYTKEKLDQWDMSEGHPAYEYTWGVGHMGPRSGSRQQWNLNFNFDWRPTSWLSINAGTRYSDYWSFDEKLAKGRLKQDPNWAIQPEITGMLQYYQELLSDDDIKLIRNTAIQQRQEVIDWSKDFMEKHPEVGDILSDYLAVYPTADSIANEAIDALRNEDGYLYSQWSNMSHPNPNDPSIRYVVIPYGGSHKGFAANNPFLNGTINPDEWVENAQGTSKTMPKYIFKNSMSSVIAPDSTVVNKWAEPEKQKNHDWVPYLGITAALSDHARVYVRYNEFVRFPTVFESSLALAGSNKRATGAANAPEHAYNWELGYAHNLKSFSVFDQLDYADIKINYFNNRIENYIDRDYNFNIVQFAEKKMSGIELLTRLDSGKYFGSFGATYRLKQEVCDRDYASYLDPIYNRISECIDGGFPLTFARTSLQPKYSLNFDLGARLFDEKLKLGGRAVYHSEAKNKSESEFGEMGWAFNRAYYWNPILVFDAYMNYQAHPNVRLDFNITNITNQYYIDPMARVSLPAPGRAMTAGVTFKF
ncbi:TonB-dependent receptor domain-containing protein [Acinetobacter rudis]|uniref:TonB-dependent receptor domain-containing protein n=1 Tax=Acinetobacter rudis TaxID=632955 RepID=UPI00334054AD